MTNAIIVNICIPIIIINFILLACGGHHKSPRGLSNGGSQWTTNSPNFDPIRPKWGLSDHLGTYDQVHHVWIEKLSTCMHLACHIVDQSVENCNRTAWFATQMAGDDAVAISSGDYHIDSPSGTLIVDPFTSLKNKHGLFVCVSRSTTTGGVCSVTVHHIIVHPMTNSSENDQRILHWGLKEKIDLYVPLMRPSQAIEGFPFLDTSGHHREILQAFDFHRVQLENLVKEWLQDVCGIRLDLIHVSPKSSHLFEDYLHIVIRQDETDCSSTPSSLMELLQSGSMMDYLAIGPTTWLGLENNLKVELDSRRRSVLLHLTEDTSGVRKPNLVIEEDGCPQEWVRYEAEHVTRCLPAEAQIRRVEAEIESIEANEDPPTIEPTAVTWKPGPEFEYSPNWTGLMRHLQPDKKQLVAQEEAAEMVSQLYHLGFTDGEISLMVFLSSAIAGLGFAMTVTIYLAMNEPLSLSRRQHGRNKVQRIIVRSVRFILSVLRAIVKLPKQISTGILRRLKGEANFIRRSMYNSTAAKLVRDSLNIYRQQALEEQMVQFRILMHLQPILVQLTIDRIVETASVAREMPPEEAAETLLTGHVKIAPATPVVLRPYLRLPRHHDAAFFLLHSQYWDRLRGFQTSFPAPTKPLNVEELTGEKDSCKPRVSSTYN